MAGFGGIEGQVACGFLLNFNLIHENENYNK
jgi:hypothetical protein